MDTYTITAIVLVKNEDLFIERVLTNLLGFCDQIIVADNVSSDGTVEIVKQLCRQHGKIQYHRIEKISSSHDLIKGYAGKKVWVFGVDGDEIYDPKGLVQFRRELLACHYDNWWMIFGNVLHCTDLDSENKNANGYLSPPCRSMTKLYNFGLIDSWQSSSGERLHGGEIVFKKGYGKELRCQLYEDVAWEDSLFRCLHMCFLQRSSQQRSWKGKFVPRPNPADILSRTYAQKIWAGIRKACGVPVPGKTEWKMEKFTRGSVRSFDVSTFFEDI